MVERNPFRVELRPHQMENGRPMFVPVISHSGSCHHPAFTELPICYNSQIPNQQETMIRLAHVLCRQADYMTASKYDYFFLPLLLYVII